ncbi:MAG: heat-inducible transcription repressor HrcA [Ruminococcaceae bacterium]|nr:heat-inducible transcription repressor HrcA [Oscillospiraceae bacterium]
MRHDPSELSERKKMILKAIIEAHIELGEPVGSKYIMQRGDIKYSSATIRNEMAELEEMGYLEQPHTSAGRIPSELGYRFYVDSLIESYDLTAGEIGELQSSLAHKQAELDHILNTAMQLAASMTNYTALAVKPRVKGFTVRKYNLMTVDDYNLVLVMVISTGGVKTKNIYSEREVPQEAAEMLTGLLNKYLVGVTSADITLNIIMEMERQMGMYDFLVSPIIKTVYEVINSAGGGELMLEGVNKLLSYPEFYDMDRLQNMLTLLEDKEDLLDVISDETAEGGGDGVKVFIGSENVVKTMDNSTLIFKPIVQKGKTVGAIGIIGPTRMDYPRVIAMIDRLTAGIAEIMGGAAALPPSLKGKDGSEEE